MKNFMRGGQPFRRCREAEKKQKEEKKIKKNIREEIRKNDKDKEKADLKREVLKLRAKLRQEARDKTAMPAVNKFLTEIFIQRHSFSNIFKHWWGTRIDGLAGQTQF